MRLTVLTMNSACRIWIRNETRALFQSKKWVKVVSNSLIFLMCTLMIDNQQDIMTLQRVYFFKSFFVVYRVKKELMVAKIGEEKRMPIGEQKDIMV